MDKYEYKVRSEEITKLIDQEKYVEAANVADTVDWRRVKSISMLLKIAALYSINRRNEDSRDILVLAYEKYPTNRSVVYSLCEISIELDDVVAAIEYYKQYAKMAPKDIGVITLRYRILEAQEASLEERVALLEELKKKDYQEEWAYELAYLYHRIGLATKCVEECDDIILWFGDGPYVMKAMELKQLHVPLTEVQQAKYEAMLGNSQDNYSEEAYTQDEGYSENLYSENDGYAEGGYTNDGYTENSGYTGEDAYTESSYINNGYSEEHYTDDGYAESGEYTEDSEYAENRYTENEYANEYYTEEYADDNFYTEQTYDNNRPIIYEDGVNSSYTSTYHETPQPSSSPMDMSLYNTINLQKVVAEGMMEIFSDTDDVLAQQREEFAIGAEEAAEELMPDEFPEQAVKTDIQEKEDDISEEAVETAPHAETVEEVYTGKVAMITSGVSETEPEPDTGAVKKVFVPDESARAIKAESDIDMLRDTTERSVNEEHIRMDQNSENVYHTTDLMNEETGTEASFQPMTGQMNIGDVLSEWENIKLNNAKKHQEEIKQRVLTQTGKIFASFDDSLKSGILGELEKEEKKDTFLAADVTGDLPKAQAGETSDDEYDVSYVAPGSNAQIIAEIGAVVAKELGATRIVPQDEINRELAQAQQESAEKHPAMQEIEMTAQADEEPYDNTDDYYDAQAESYEEENSAYDDSGEEYDVPVDSYDDSVEAIETSEEVYNDVNESYEEINETYDEEGIYYNEAEEDYSDSSEYYVDPNEAYHESDEVDSEAADETLYKEIETQDAQTAEEVRELDPEDAESIAETAIEDALKTQEIKMNTADLSSLSERIVETAKRETTGARREEVREFTSEEQKLFENFAVTKKIKKQILYALENMTLAAFTGNVIITGDTGIDTVRMAKNLIREFQASDANFSGKVAKITGEKLNQKNLKDVFEKLNNGGIIIEKANGMTEEKLYELATFLNQENLGIVVILEDTKKEITRLLEKQAMIIDYFNIRIDLMEMDNNALVAYARNYALALEYSIDELGILALYTRIANIQSGNHVVTKDEVREIIDEAIWKSKKSKIKNFVDVLFARRYDSEDMIVLKERDFM